ncbi:LytR/AlgR family response regulator transcription factor [Dyadobacter alkalitolerans]|uniref:LytR/AlgR family response regulator transcription factor n=1 Tax=Dyadobacter alkalitolerans TaxID=492736 RepID=UPI0003F58D2D|nr:LytTR family DNA-binding domain-containing protein [Dyadobacter alkalitolerans]
MNGSTVPHVRFIAIDDNPLDLLFITEFAKASPFLQNCGAFSSALEGYEAQQYIKPDLVFWTLKCLGSPALNYYARSGPRWIWPFSLQAMQDYTKIITPQKNYITLSTLTCFMEQLPADRFMRVHRSYAVSLNQIKELRHSEVVCNNTIIP